MPRRANLPVLLLWASTVFARSVTFPENESKITGLPPASAAYFLGLKILNSAVTSDTNSVISPSSIYSCLWLLYQGANGDTKNEIGNILGDIHNFNTTSQIKNLPDAFTADSLFLDYSAQVNPAYIAAVDNNVFSVNFSDESAARDTINRWVSSETRGTIPQLLYEALDSSTRAIVVSALYFNGEWLYKFDPSAVKIGKFELNENESIDTPLMTTSGVFPVYKGTYYKAVGLPYVNNGFTLYLILPHATGFNALKSVLKNMTPDSLLRMMERTSNESVIVTIPKFKLDFRIGLKPILTSFGLNKMFDSRWADFSDIIAGKNEPNLFVSEMHHSVHLEVDETGTRAAAATIGIVTKGNHMLFRATRPFAFILRHSSGHTLFLGTVTKPCTPENC